MDQVVNFALSHTASANWLFFGLILLAGMNIPISADIIILLAALLAAKSSPEIAILLYVSIYCSCVLSAWIAYAIGYHLIPKLHSFSLFNRVFKIERLEKMRHFYEKYGFWTLLVGRFIPFGVRNCIFMTAGFSRFSFRRFALRDLIACFVWSASIFSLFYLLGHNFDELKQSLKTANLWIFAAFGVTVIGVFWYKRLKNRAFSR